MNLVEKCFAIGIGNGTSTGGYPEINGRIIRKIEGSLKAFFNEELKPWEHPREDTKFDTAILAKIQAIEDDKLDQLSQNEQDMIIVKETEETEKASVPPIEEIWAKVQELDGKIAVKVI